MKDPSIIKNNAHVDFNDINLDNVRFSNNFGEQEVNSFPKLEEHLTPKSCIDQAMSDGVDESSLLSLDPDEKLDEQDSIVFNSTLTLPKLIIKIHTKNYVDKKCNDPSIIKIHLSC